MPEVCHRHVQIAAVGGELLGDKVHQRGRLEIARIGGGEEGVEKERRLAPEVGAEAVPVAAEITELSCENAALQQRIELHAQILLPACGGAVEISVVAEDCDAVFGQIIRRRTEFRVDHAQVAVACPEEAVGTQGLQICLQGFDQGCMGRLAPLLPGDQLLQRRAEAVRPAGVEHGEGLRHRQDHRMRNILNPALGQRVKQAHRVDLVSEELHAQRIVHRGAVNVQNPAPDGKLSHALDHLTAGIAALHQPGGQVLQIIEPAGTQVNRRAQQRPMRQGTQRQGLKGGNHQPLGPGHHAVEQAQTLLLPLARGGGGVVKGQLTRRQDGEVRSKKGRQLLLGPAAGQLVLTQHQHRRVQIPIQAGNQMRAVDLSGPGHADAPPAPQGLADRFVFWKFAQGGEQQLHRVFLHFKDASIIPRPGASVKHRCVFIVFLAFLSRHFCLSKHPCIPAVHVLKCKNCTDQPCKTGVRTA